MTRLLSVVCALLASNALLVLASPVQARTPYAVKETHRLPRQWKHVKRAVDEHMLDLKIGLKQSNFEELERQLYEVSDPDHSRYGQHLSADEVTQLIKPSDRAIDSVHSWLKDCGVNSERLSYSAAKDWIELRLPLSEVEKLLDTEYHVYEHEDGTRLVRTLEWSLPRHLHEHIDAIQPTTSFFRNPAQKSTALDLKATVPAGYTPPTDPLIAKVCNVTSVTPQCFMHLYGTYGYTVQSADENGIAFNNYLGEIPIRPDAVKFATKYRPDAVSQANTFPQYSIAGGPAQDGPLTRNQSIAGISKEANLDLQAILGISNPTPVTSYSTGGQPPFNPDTATTKNTNEPYLTWLNYILNKTDDEIPPVISTSYGDDEQSVPYAYALRVCQSFALLGARGKSVLFSSGDSGVGSPGTCLTNDGKNTTTFLPSFPPSCPFVTAVGATHQFQPEVVAYRPATVVNGTITRNAYVSGGGFGNYFAQPAYQSAVVKSYVKSLNGSFSSYYNASGRAYPDIAAQGQYFAYFWNGTEGTISGTSASTPLMSGIIALVNDALLAAGRRPLGFLNPWIYKKGYKGFTDITGGNLEGCGVAGFPAQKGWDVASGFGTPNFPALVKLAGGSFDGFEKDDDDSDD